LKIRQMERYQVTAFTPLERKTTTSMGLSRVRQEEKCWLVSSAWRPTMNIRGLPEEENPFSFQTEFSPVNR
jgi:hypothetical protein